MSADPILSRRHLLTLATAGAGAMMLGGLTPPASARVVRSAPVVWANPNWQKHIQRNEEGNIHLWNYHQAIEGEIPWYRPTMEEVASPNFLRTRESRLQMAMDMNPPVRASLQAHSSLRKFLVREEGGASRARTLYARQRHAVLPSRIALEAGSCLSPITLQSNPTIKMIELYFGGRPRPYISSRVQERAARSLLRQEAFELSSLLSGVSEDRGDRCLIPADSFLPEHLQMAIDRLGTDISGAEIHLWLNPYQAWDMHAWWSEGMRMRGPMRQVVVHVDLDVDYRKIYLVGEPEQNGVYHQELDVTTLPCEAAAAGRVMGVAAQERLQKGLRIGWLMFSEGGYGVHPNMPLCAMELVPSPGSRPVRWS